MATLLQYSCLENPFNRGAWQATVHRVAKSQTQLKRLNTDTHYSLPHYSEFSRTSIAVYNQVFICLFLCLFHASLPTRGKALTGQDLVCSLHDGTPRT